MRLGQWQTWKEFREDLDKLCEQPAPPCVAYCDDGTICGKPALIVDPQRGGMVCKAHAPAIGYWHCLVCDKPTELNMDGPANVCANCRSPRVRWKGGDR